MATVTPIPPAAEPASVGRATRARVLGGLLGAGLGIAGMALLYALGTAAGFAAHPAFALVIGPDGIFSPTNGAPFVWVVPPLAAGLAGALLARRAARRARWAGVTMGYLTYALGIAIGPIFVLFLPSIGAEGGAGAVGILDAGLSLLIGIGVLWLIGAVALAPLLVVCAAAGVAWAAGLRALLPPIEEPIAPGTPGVAPEPGRGILSGVALIVIAGVLGFLWALLTTFLQILVDSQAT